VPGDERVRVRLIVSQIQTVFDFLHYVIAQCSVIAFEIYGLVSLLVFIVQRLRKELRR
jgi:hypothetical protein